MSGVWIPLERIFPSHFFLFSSISSTFFLGHHSAYLFGLIPLSSSVIISLIYLSLSVFFIGLIWLSFFISSSRFLIFDLISYYFSSCFYFIVIIIDRIASSRLMFSSQNCNLGLSVPRFRVNFHRFLSTRKILSLSISLIRHGSFLPTVYH